MGSFAQIGNVMTLAGQGRNKVTRNRIAISIADNSAKIHLNSHSNSNHLQIWVSTRSHAYLSLSCQCLHKVLDVLNPNLRLTNRNTILVLLRHRNRDTILFTIMTPMLTLNPNNLQAQNNPSLPEPKKKTETEFFTIQVMASRVSDQFNVLAEYLPMGVPPQINFSNEGCNAGLHEELDNHEVKVRDIP